MPAPLALPLLVRQVTTEALALAQTLGQAEEIQWKPSLAPTARDDTTERSRGGHGDPTVSTVLDGRRLNVRAAVVNAEGTLERLIVALRETREHLEDSIDEWNGN